MEPSLNRIEDILTQASRQVCVCFTFRKAARAVTQYYDRILRPTGLRATQLTLLVSIRILEPVTLKKLAEATVMDRTTMTRNLDLLKKKGLVLLEPGRDRRERLASLTDEGRKKFQEALPLWKTAQDRILDRLGEEKWSGLRAGVAELVVLTRRK